MEIQERSFGKLHWSIEPENATDQRVKFEVEDPSIIQVQDNGEIVALQKGETTVKVSTVDGSYEANCVVSVIEAEEDEFDHMREYWEKSILGTPYDENDEKVQEILEQVVEDATIYWETMNKEANREYLWEEFRETDKEVPPTKAKSAHVRSMYLNLKEMAKAYKLPGSSLYGNQELLKDIIQALNFLYQKHYYAGKAPYNNWWHWEIGIPVALNDIVVLLYDELSPIQIKNYMDAIEYFQPDPTKSGVNAVGTSSPNLREAVGVNRVDVSKVVAVRGVIVKDGEKIDDMKLYNEAKEIVSDSQIPTRAPYIKHVQFPNMDRVVHHRPGYAFGIASHSKRIGNYEAMNNENTKGWYSGDGMTYLYNEDLGQYTHYWPTVDPYRMPGTTEDTEERKDNSGQKRKLGKTMSSKTWVGGTSIIDKYGIWGMDFESWDASLEAKKSWFMFDDEIVALGAGIHSEKTNVSVETTIENRKLNKEGTNSITIGKGEEKN